MSDGGCLSCACELRREVTTLSSRLAGWLDAQGPAFDDAYARSWFGVSRDTLDRIADGSVEPDDVVAERIGEVIDGPQPAPAPVRRSSAPPTPPAPDVGRAWPRPSVTLVSRDGLADEIHLVTRGEPLAMPKEAARGLLVDLFVLLALSDQEEEKAREGMIHAA